MADDKPPPEDLDSTETLAHGSTPPQRIGNYRILQKLGEGGMGVVYLAEQEKPIRRRVALKIIKLGMDTKAVTARFEAERQALAMMNHPNVAKVFDAGTTEQGRPYFVMEYVKGVPITVHCDRQRLTTKERLEIFTRVCEGVQHAHQKAIIHRDLKPSNVLVTIQDEKSVPKIIDFGVAKAIEHRLTEQTLFTELGQIIGTPEYMSPEQAEMSTQDIDTRTDVYSLGVMLYELLVGALPFDPKELRQAGFDEIRRRIREEEPSKPSTRFASLGEASTDSAENRQTDAASLTRLLRGDLDWITMKALEKDRARRYVSASELALEVGRFQRDEPVLAGPPSSSYRIQKFIARHRLGVGASCLVLLAMLVALIVIIWGQHRVIQAERAARILSEVSSLTNLAEVYVAAQEFEEARSLYEQALGKVNESAGPDSPDAARVLIGFANALLKDGQFKEASSRYEQALRTLETVDADADADMREALLKLAEARESTNEYEKAGDAYEKALAIQKRVLGPEHPSTLGIYESLGRVFRQAADYEHAQQAYEEMLSIVDTLGTTPPLDWLMSIRRVWLARLYIATSELMTAADLFRQSSQAGGPAGDVTDAHKCADRAAVTADLESVKSALQYCEPDWAFHVAERGPGHPTTLAVANTLASLYEKLAWYAEEQYPYTMAENLYSHALENQRSTLGNDHPSTLTSIDNLGGLYVKQQRYDEAGILLKEALESRRRVLGDTHPEVGRSHYNLACLSASLGDLSLALNHLRRSMDLGWAEIRIQDEPSLEMLRNSVEFEAIVAEVRKRIGEE